MKQIKDLSPEELSRFAEWIREEHDIPSEDDIEKEWDECLDEYPVKIGSLEYSGSYALKELDPTAYRCGFNDWIDGDYFDLADYDLGSGYVQDDPADLLDDFIDAVLLQYNYIVDFDERGEYRAHVEDWDGKTVYSLEAEQTAFDEIELPDIVDGFMQHTQDMDGLAEHLQELGIIPVDAVINYQG